MKRVDGMREAIDENEMCMARSDMIVSELEARNEVLQTETNQLKDKEAHIVSASSILIHNYPQKYIFKNRMI